MSELRIKLPELHEGQQHIVNESGKLNAVRCGRRWGKTQMLVHQAAVTALQGLKVGLFTPQHAQLREPFNELKRMLSPVISNSNANEGVIRLITGHPFYGKGSGQIDFWSLDDNLKAGRGREYDLVMIDEAAFTKDDQMRYIWDTSIAPTMATRPDAKAYALSTPHGNNPTNFFYYICEGYKEDKEVKQYWKQFHAPTSTNPYMPPSQLELYKKEYHPLIFRQEFEAHFVNGSGDALIEEANMLIGARGVPEPKFCEYVVAVVDTGMKGGVEHDGTAVVYFAHQPWGPHEYRLIILDYDIVSIDGMYLEKWIPSVFERLDELSVKHHARMGSQGAYIEDAAAGIVLLQQCQAKGLPVHPISSKLTQLGKDARVMATVNFVHQGLVKYTQFAYDRDRSYKGATRNHLRSQLTSFRLGDKDAYKRQDDLLDCFTYGCQITLGNNRDYMK